MTDPLVWRLTPDRAEEWRQIRLEALRLSPEAFGSTLAEWEHRPLADFAERLTTVETWAAGEQIGAPLSVAGWQPGWTPGTEDMGWITGVYTRPAARGRGMMLTLLERIGQRAAAAGFVRLGLRVRIANAPAHGVYLGAGFRDVGAPFIDEAGQIETEMQRPLT